MTMPSKDDIQRLADYYDRTDASDALEGAELDETSALGAMVTTSVRLPRATISELRIVARRRGQRPTSLIREWIEEGLARGDGDEAMIPVSKLLKLVEQAGRAATTPPPSPR